ncbi:sugar phosphate isomerase/epimerase family protein [Algoriphagus sediminis]|uniref:Sugar phosphate isomerase/epimerase n=1 Tax=Algoriphagus sediminis TaxID=3057113 RepID=A0ABT7Y9K5_9BACT|nr:sugar phosphate isomerase/epimerase [Algoriphagus sediminis]MDN3203195.1 sugar phosphate isomerase/epimerase [Algoriphagus sediminis]
MKVKTHLNALLVAAAAATILACGSPEKSEKTSETMMEESQEEARFGGLALYTLRDAMSEDPTGTLQKVADAGYAYVEAAGYENGKFYGMEPVEFKEYLESLGMKAVSSHMGMVTLENVDQLIEDTKAAGITYFVIPVPPMGMFTFGPDGMGMKGTPEELVSILNTLGKKCSEAGLELLYHNHDFEFMENENGVILADYILENTDPAEVNFQMDLYWVTKAGAKANDYFAKYPGRIKAWHVKDMNSEGQFAPVGTGLINFSQILAEKEKAGMEVYFVEQDQTFDLDPLEAIKISHDGLKTFGFE